MVCRKRSCYDTRNCFIDSLASRLHISQFVTWPISIFQADVDKNPSAPHTRLHFVMTRRMHGRRGTEKGSHRLLLLSLAVLLHGEEGGGRGGVLPYLCSWPSVFFFSVMSPQELPPWSHIVISDQALSGARVPNPLPRRIR